jgi:hypothetical protein
MPSLRGGGARKRRPKSSVRALRSAASRRRTGGVGEGVVGGVLLGVEGEDHRGFADGFAGGFAVAGELGEAEPAGGFGVALFGVVGGPAGQHGHLHELAEAATDPHGLEEQGEDAGLDRG